MNANSPLGPSPGLGTILLIEDESPASQALEEQLVKRDFKVEIARTAGGAARRLGELAYTGVVLDLILPDDLPQPLSQQSQSTCRWKGMELLRQIRQGEFAQKGVSAKVPVFVLTCVPDEDTQKELVSLRVQESWLKPERPWLVAERIKLFFQGDTRV